jgi:hypothetical protein
MRQKKTEGTDGKQQYGKLTPNHINNYIKSK